MTHKIKLHHFLLFIAVISLTACDSLPSLNDTFAGRKVDYKKQSRSINRLEVPPDMAANQFNEDLMPVRQIASVNEVKTTQNVITASSVLPEQKDIRIIHEGDIRFLEIQSDKQSVWNKMREFWLNKGMLIKRETPATGILETEWAENRADIPEGFIRSALGKVFEGAYSAGTRDKYRVRIENVNAQKTNLYITHYGVQEVLQGGGDSERVIWTPRPRDPELEAEMLSEMVVFFGMEEKKAKLLLAKQEQQRVDRAVMARDTEGYGLLIVKETFPRTWRRTGIALDRINFVVEDRDADQGIYHVSYSDPLAEEDKGWFSKLNFWGEEKQKFDKYQIRLTVKDDHTIIKVNDDKGQPLATKTAQRILSLLHEQLK